MRTLKQKILAPQTPWESVVSNAYHMSFASVGRDGIREMQQRDHQVEAAPQPQRGRDASFYIGEYQRLTADAKARVGSFQQFIKQRQAGRVDAHGKPTA